MNISHKTHSSIVRVFAAPTLSYKRHMALPLLIDIHVDMVAELPICADSRLIHGLLCGGRIYLATLENACSWSLRFTTTTSSPTHSWSSPRSQLQCYLSWRLQRTSPATPRPLSRVRVAGAKAEAQAEPAAAAARGPSMTRENGSRC